MISLTADDNDEANASDARYSETANSSKIMWRRRWAFLGLGFETNRFTAPYGIQDTGGLPGGISTATASSSANASWVSTTIVFQGPVEVPIEARPVRRATSGNTDRNVTG